MSIDVANWDLGSGSYWGSGLKLTAGIWDISLCLQLLDTSLVSRLSFLLESNPPFFPLSPFNFFSFPSFLQINEQTCKTERVSQGRELPLIQIFCKWFVLFLSRCSHLIELCCRSESTLTKAAIIPPILFYVSRLSLPAGGSVRNRQPLGYNADSLMLPGARQRRGLILDPFHLLLFPS